MRIEILEARLAPASVTLSGGTLAIVGDAGADLIQVSSDTTTVSVQDGPRVVGFPAAQVQRVVIDGGPGDDVLTQLVGTIPTVLVGGEGADNLWTFGSDVLLGGDGADTLYSIVGASFIDGGAGSDRVIGNGSSVIPPDMADRPPVVFRQRDPVIPVLDAGVIYFPGTPGPDQLVITNLSPTLLRISYNGGVFLVDPRVVTQFAGVLGGGNDLVYLADMTSRIDAVFYSADGADWLVGGPGNDLLKGGGGNDVISGWAGDDDLTGDGGSDFVAGNAGRDLLRVDATDTLVADAVDIVLALLGRRP